MQTRNGTNLGRDCMKQNAKLSGFRSRQQQRITELISAHLPRPSISVRQWDNRVIQRRDAFPKSATQKPQFRKIKSGKTWRKQHFRTATAKNRKKHGGERRPRGCKTRAQKR
eukprot:TRINITY_DN18_c0_g1_i1.p1 TRINITY_DN18_c0_g1~~TRINITY_DN18_c0_g1_i1.p1  ORF type:complete len:112 (+),score=8.83 TRINITY_DN18_c0_g1_i1:316-651(+)